MDNLTLSLLDGNYWVQKNWYSIEIVDGSKADIKESDGKTFDMNI